MEIIISNFDISNMNGDDSLILIACARAGERGRGRRCGTTDKPFISNSICLELKLIITNSAVVFV